MSRSRDPTPDTAAHTDGTIAGNTSNPMPSATPTKGHRRSGRAGFSFGRGDSGNKSRFRANTPHVSATLGKITETGQRVTLASAQPSSAPYPQLRAAAALAYQVPLLGVQLTSGSRVREVGTLVYGSDQVHPADFRDLVATAVDTHSLEPIYVGLDLPIGNAIEVRLISRSNECVARPGGVIRAGSSTGVVYLFATDLWWPATVSVLLDETVTASIVSARFGQIDQYLDIVQSVDVDSAFDDALSISLITVRHPRHGVLRGVDRAVAEETSELVTAVTESIAQGLAERLSSLTVLR
jgi:hypothetical protein